MLRPYLQVGFFEGTLGSSWISISCSFRFLTTHFKMRKVHSSINSGYQRGNVFTRKRKQSTNSSLRARHHALLQHPQQKLIWTHQLLHRLLMVAMVRLQTNGRWSTIREFMNLTKQDDRRKVSMFESGDRVRTIIQLCRCGARFARRDIGEIINKNA